MEESITGDGPSDRTRALIEGPILRALLSLAAPTIAVMAIQTGVGTAETYFVSFLGPEALAGVALSFPLNMLMTTMSAGAMGGGMSSAVARALGAGKRELAEEIATHSVLIALAMGFLFMVAGLTLAPTLFAWMGARGPVWEAARLYSGITFCAAVPLWLLNASGSVLRGSGDAVKPASVSLAGAVFVVTMSPAMIFGWGPLPRLGIAGAALALAGFYTLGAAALLFVIMSGRASVRLKLRGFRPRLDLFTEILKVGLPSSINSVFTNLTVLSFTALVTPLGPAATAGYGVASRLEYLLIPLVFGLGSAIVPLVGANAGAGKPERVRQAVRTGALLSVLLTGSVGLLVALRPRVWMGIFGSDETMLATGAAYLVRVGPVYGFLGLGMALYFACQGVGQAGWPLAASFLRLAVGGLGGLFVTRVLGLGAPGLFGVIALALAVYGLAMLGVIARVLEGS